MLAAPRPTLLRDTARYLPGTLLPGALALLSTIVFARILAVGDFGIYALAIAVMSTGSALTAQWVVQGMNRYLPGGAALRAPGLKTAALILATGSALIAAAVMIVTALAVGAGQSPRWAPALWPVALYLVVGAVGMVLGGVLQAEHRAARFSAYRTAEAVLRFAAGVTLVLLIPHPASAIWAAPLAALLVLPLLWRAAGVGAEGAAGHASRRSGWPSTARIRLSAVRVVRYGVPMGGWFLAASMLEVGDRFVLQFFRGSQDVGLYAANYAIVAGVVAVACAPVLYAAHPILMRAWNTGEKAAAANLLGQVIHMLAAATLVGTGILVLFARDLSVVLLGPAYNGHAIMPIVFAGHMLWHIAAYAHKPLEFGRRTRTMMIGAGAAAALNLGLNFLLVPRYGIMAAAWTTLAAYAGYLLACGWLGQRTLHWPARPLRLTGIAAATLAAVAAADLLRDELAARVSAGTGAAAALAVMLVLATVTATVSWPRAGLQRA
jgi:O-antigen/teichoic acid export membrane protein